MKKRKNGARPTLFAIVGAVALLGVSGCSHMGALSDVAATVGEATGTVSSEQAESMRKSGAAVGRAFEQITPEQEYYIGRSVAATLLAQYDVWDDPAATHYINVVGRALAMASELPETFGGYRFLILDSDEINAFAAPGGLVLISRGMLALCRTEDELAAVLAHEIGHVQHQHGLKAIRRGRLTSAVTILAMEAGKQLAGENLAELTRAFEGSVSDITYTLSTRGYARSAEREADRAALAILNAVGYDSRALVSMLKEMEQQIIPGRPDFARTHPPPRQRISEIERDLQGISAQDSHPARSQRFSQAIQR